jgi:uncharacterized protein (DUF2141 family)
MRLMAAASASLAIILGSTAGQALADTTGQEAPGAKIVIFVTNVRNANGVIRAALCRRPEFLGKHCNLEITAPAQFGTVRLTLNGVPPDRYAIQAWHDESNNGKISRTLLGIPREGVGFSNDPHLLLGPPSFKESAIPVTSGENAVSFKLRYF